MFHHQRIVVIYHITGDETSDLTISHTFIFINNEFMKNLILLLPLLLMKTFVFVTLLFSTSLCVSQNDTLYDCEFIWESNNWVENRHYTFIYNQTGSLIKEIVSKDSSNSWGNPKRSTVTYDINGNVIETVDEIWNSSLSSLEYSQRRTSTYSQNNKTEQLVETWNTGNGNWEFSYKNEFYYDSNNIIEKDTALFWGANSNQWIYRWNIDYINFDTINQRKTVSVWDTTATQWIPQSMDTLTYDGNNNNISITASSWDTLNSQWTPTLYDTLIYDGSYNLTNSTKSLWNGFQWDYLWRREYQYDFSSNVTLRTHQNWSGSAWLNASQIAKDFDFSNNMTMSVDRSWDGLIWVTDDSTSNSYNLNGDIETTYEACYDDCDGDGDDLTFLELFGTYSYNNNELVNFLGEVKWYLSNFQMVNSQLIEYSSNVICQVNSTTSIQEQMIPSSIIYPNPAISYITVESSSTIKIYDMMGRLVLSKNSLNQKETIDISSLTNGIYNVKMDNKTDKLIIQK